MNTLAGRKGTLQAGAEFQGKEQGRELADRACKQKEHKGSGLKWETQAACASS